LTARSAYRERPLTRVIFDRRLRTPPSARVLSTPEAGPVIIVADQPHDEGAGARRALEAAGAEGSAGNGSLRHARTQLGERRIGSIVIEGGATIHAAAWDEGVVDFVRLYVAPRSLGRGVPLLDGRAFAASELMGRRVAALGPDVLIEGYVHRPR